MRVCRLHEESALQASPKDFSTLRSGLPLSPVVHTSPASPQQASLFLPAPLREALGLVSEARPLTVIATGRVRSRATTAEKAPVGI
jgi:hypothetical protein